LQKSKIFRNIPGFLGIIGGLGPETSSKFHLDLIRKCRNELKTQPRIIMSIAPVPEEVEARAINGDLIEMKPILEECVLQLNNAGVSAIVIPCNTVHALFDDLQKQSAVPIISILDETVKEIQRLGIFNIGLLATTTTFKLGLLQPKLNEANIGFITPSNNEQEKISKAIEYVLKNGEASEESREIIKQIILRMKKDGAEAIVLSCTDLQFLAPKESKILIIDSLAVLTNASFEVLKKHLSKV